MALTADNDRLASQGGIEQFFHRDEEGVHVNVEDGPQRGGHRDKFLSPLLGLGFLLESTQGLRPGLHSFAASRLFPIEVAAS
jgi:hypothetical protein